MRVLIRTRSRLRNRDAGAERIVETDTLHIGSGEDQDLRIPDPRIALLHVELGSTRPGHFTVRALSPSGFRVKGKTLQFANLELGDSFDFGRFRLHLLPARQGHDVLLEQEELRSARDDRMQRLADLRKRVGGEPRSRRAWSFSLFAIILMIGLVAPVLLRYGLPQQDKFQILPPEVSQPKTGLHKVALIPWLTDRVWTPGESSPVHAHFQNDCGQCHDKAFERVRNTSCLNCHENTRQHVDDTNRLEHPDFATAQCESCHVEHQGEAGMSARQDQRCTLCHAEPRKRFPDSTIEVAADFSKHHPVFTPAVARYDKATRTFAWQQSTADPATAVPVRYLPPPGGIRSDSNLRYPHDKHLDPNGIKSPTGLRVLKCDACHVPDGSGIGFRAISMPQHCSECHRLDFDPDDPLRVVPHGSEAAVIDTIRDYYGRIALGGGVAMPGVPDVVQFRRKPGQALSADEATAALSWAEQRSKLVIDEVFDKRVCTYCHVVERTPGPDAAARGKTVPIAVAASGKTLVLAPMPRLPWQIAPVELATHRLKQSSPFPHAQHATAKCSSCHAAGESKVSEDVLTPPISRCRDCHGDRGTSAKIQSVCTDCHGYHLADHAEMKDKATVSPPPTLVQKLGLKISETFDRLSGHEASRQPGNGTR